MTNLTTRKSGLFSTVVVMYGIMGCAQPTFESFLPSTWPDGLETVFRNAERFEVPASGEIASGRPGDFLDPLGDLTGCWGGYAPEWIGASEGYPTNLYQSIVFRPDGTFTRSAMNELPGQIALIFVQEGRYRVETPNKVQLLDVAISTFSPNTRTYVPFNVSGMADQVLLATRDGDLLRLENESPDDGSSTVAYTPIVKKFDCGG